MWVAFALQKLLTFFQQKFQHVCVSLDVNFNKSLTNDIVSFEQLGPDFFDIWLINTKTRKLETATCLLEKMPRLLVKIL